MSPSVCSPGREGGSGSGPHLASFLLGGRYVTAPHPALLPLPPAALINTDDFSPPSTAVLRAVQSGVWGGSQGLDLQINQPSLSRLRPPLPSRWVLRRRARLWLRPGMTEAFSEPMLRAQPQWGRVEEQSLQTGLEVRPPSRHAMNSGLSTTLHPNPGALRWHFRGLALGRLSG